MPSGGSTIFVHLWNREPPEFRECLEGRRNRGRVRLRREAAAPRRTILPFNNFEGRSGRTCTTIMWMELVPMSIAAIRMADEVERQGWLGNC